MIIDIFTYTHASPNGAFSLEALINAARAAHLDGIAVTDRASSRRAREYADIAARENFFVAIGVELETSSGKVTVFPAAIDDEFVAEGWRTLGETPVLEDVLDYFHDRGGIVIARDIYNKGEGLKDRVYSARDSKGRGFDAIDTLAPYRRRIDNELSIEAQQVTGLPACAGSSTLGDIELIGHCATLFADKIHDQASFIAAMRAPLHWASALADLGAACPMGTPPKTEDDGDRRREFRGERRGDARRDRRDGDRRDGNRRDSRGRDRRDGDRGGRRDRNRDGRRNRSR